MGIDDAVLAWRAAIGDAFVTTEGDELDAVQTATYRTSQRVPALVRPGDADEVRACLRVARAHGVAVYPVSAGKNWGYGSRVPPADGCAVLSLDRLDRILDFDESLAYVTVEPGVTFDDVYRFLLERGSDLTLGAPGSTHRASVVGNALERGISSGLDGDRISNVCGIEALLADGTCVRTGLGRFEGATAAPVFAHGVGPSLDGLFAQSSLGVVTKMTVWLTPIPEYFRYVSFAASDRARLGPLVEAVRAIKRARLVDTSVGLFNDFKILGYLRQFPSDRSQDRRLDLSRMPAEYARGLEGGAWFGELAVTAPSAAVGDLLCASVERELHPVVDRLDFGEPGTDNPMVGRPADSGLASVYWRKGSAPPANMDPDRDRCGVIWCCPVVPLRGDDVVRCCSILESVMSEHEFEPFLGAQCLSPRAAYVVASVVYDRDRPGHDERALACHDACLRRLAREGLVPYRLATASSPDALPPATDDTARVLAKIKAAVDPAGILAPGRYDARRRPSSD